MCETCKISFVEEKMDALLLNLSDKEREILSEKLSNKGNA